MPSLSLDETNRVHDNQQKKKLNYNNFSMVTLFGFGKSFFLLYERNKQIELDCQTQERNKPSYLFKWITFQFQIKLSHATFSYRSSIC